jgi:predicted O-methyltransferase YrrM
VPAAHSREVRDRLLRDGEVVARSDGSRHRIFPVAIGEREGAALEAWVRREDAHRTIEVGLGYGIAALFVCAALADAGSDCTHTAIDPHQSTRFAGCGVQVIADAGFADMVELVEEPSEIALPRLLGEQREFDLAFVDGNHRFDGVFLDLVYLGRLVRRRGIVVADDYQLPSVARAVAFCTTNLGWTVVETSSEDPQHHWVAVRTAPSPDTRPYDHFTEF